MVEQFWLAVHIVGSVVALIAFGVYAYRIVTKR